MPRLCSANTSAWEAYNHTVGDKANARAATLEHIASSSNRNRREKEAEMERCYEIRENE
jgi:hypothetical protein